MRKTIYNFLANSETGVTNNSPSLLARVLVNNKINFASVKKLVCFLFILALSSSVNAQVDVTSSGGTASATYTTLRTAFNAVNSGTHTGVITLSITANTTEPGMDSLIASGTGSASYSSIVIKPAPGATPTISGTVVGALVKLNGADNVTIDGSNNNTTSRDLSIRNLSTSTAGVTGIWIGSYTGNPANNVTVKNCNLTQSGTAIGNSSCLFYGSGVTYFSSSPAASKNMMLTNNFISRAQRGLMVLGASANPDTNLVINANTVDSINLSSMFLQAQREFNIYDNYWDYKNTTSAATSEGNGIHIVGASANGNIYRNNLFRIRHNGTVQTRGIGLASTATSPNISVFNNFFGDIWNVGISNAFSVYGLRIDNVTGGVKVYNNSFNFTTSLSNSSAVSVCLGIVSTTSANSIDIRNNIFRNIQAGGGSNYAMACLNTGATVFGAAVLSNCDNNSYFSAGANTNLYVTSSAGAQTSASSLAAIRGITGKDVNSVLVDAQFTSTTDLHLQLVAGNALLNNGGSFLAAVSTDYDGATRSINTPDIGADEIVYTPRITSFSPSTACPGTTVTVNGADFTGTTSVSLAGLNAGSFNVVSTSQLTAVVASGATSGSASAVTVTNGSGTATSSTNLNRLASGTFVSKSISTGSVGDQVTIVGTNLMGVTAVTFNGTVATYNVTNSAEIIATVPVGATTGNIMYTDACGNAINAGSFTVVVANPCATPSAQATSFMASSTTSSTLSATFTAASGSPSGYVVVYSTSALSSAPVNGQTYTAGAGFGGIIQQVSASNSVALTGLAGNTAYTVTVYSYNGGGCTGGPLYNTTSPLTYSFTTCSAIPTSVLATPVGNNSGNSINFSWGNPVGGGANSVNYTLEVTTDAGYTSPVSGSPFTTSQLTQSVSGLNFNTVYYYRIRSNNGCFSSYVSASVTSACGAGNVPFAENFDATTTSALPTCWFGTANNALSDANGDGITWQSSNIDSRATGMSNPRALRYLTNTVTTSVAANDWAYMPGVVLTGGQSYTLSFLVATVSNAGENLQVYYGSTQTPAIKINANKIYDEAGLLNRNALYKTATFTPATTGTYYLGFYTNSPSNAGGGLFLFVDDIRLDVTPSAPAAPAPVTTSNATAYSMQVNWTDNSSTEVGYSVYSSTDNVNWVLRNTVLNNVTSTVVSNLKANTTYYFKVEGYNAGGIGTGATSSAATTLTCGSYTTNAYIGTLFTGSGNNWNNTANWSQNRVPNACDDVQVNGTLPITTTCFLYLPNPVAIHNLTVDQNLVGTAIQRLFLWTQDYSFDISGDVVVANNRTANTTVTGDALYLVSGPGIMSIDGNVSMGVTGNRVSALGAGGQSLGPIYLRGNVNFGDQAFLNFGNLINYVFDAPVSQTVTINSLITSATPTAYGLGAVTIGYNNSPTVTFADTMRVNSTLSRIVGDLTINNGSTLIINDSASLNRTQSGGGTFTMGSNSTLRLKGATSGVGNSNMPDSFATYSLHNSSTVIYNGTVAQTIASAPTYGNLTLNNAAGGTLNGNTTVNNVLNLSAGKINTGVNSLKLGLSGSITGAGSTRYINGTFVKTKVADMNGAFDFEIGDATQYTPIFVGFNGPSNSGGTFSAKTTAGAPAALGFLRSGISQTNYLARTYTLSNNGITGISSVYTNFNYVNSDLVGNNNTNYRIADSSYGGGWSLRSTNSPNATSSNATNSVLAATATADFLIGEIDPAPAPSLVGFTPTSACEGSSYVITGSNFYAISSVTIGGANVPSFVVNSPTQITITVPVAIGNGVIAVSNATGTATTIGSFTTFDQPQTTVGTSSQTICSGDAITTITIGNSSNIAGTTYSWTRTGSNISGGTNAASGSSNISGTLVSSSTIPETITYTVTSAANGCAGTTAMATVVVKASPGVVNLTPTSSAICQGSVQQLVANYTAATGSSTKNSGPINLTIPDNLISGVNTTLNVTDVPAGAVVTGVEVGFSITHTYVGDLSLNITAPNGKTLNLAYQAGGSGDNFVNTVISSSALDQLPIDSTPGGITGTYLPDAFNNVGTVAYKSNTTEYSDLFATPNGTWRFSARDFFAGDAGSITNWYVKINYTLAPTFTWSPTAGLFSDAGGFTALSGTHPQTVYAKNVPGNYSYSATLSFNGCTASSTTATVDIQSVPVVTRTPATQTLCSGTAISDIVLSSVDPSAILSWSRNNTLDVTGIAASGTGNITGTLVNETSSPITVTFTITANGGGSQACQGNTLTSTVIVNPRPLASVSPASQNACSGSAINALIFNTTNGVSGTTYAWTRDNTSAATGIAASGTNFVSGTLTNASSQTTVTFSVSAVGPGASACAGAPTTATVTVYNAATAFSVTGGGSFCFPGAGLPVGLTNSQSGYTYQLLVDGSPLGSPVAGTGSAISFGNQTASGTYTVVANNAGCAKPMNGSAVLTAINTVTPTINVITSRTTICAGSNATFFAVATNTGNNPTYTFKVNGSTVQSGSSKVYISSTLLNNDVVSCNLTSTNTCQTSFNTPSNDITMIVTSGAFLPAPAALTGATTQCTIGGITYLASTTSGGVWSSSDSNIAKVFVNGRVTAMSNGVAIVSYTISSSNGCQNSASVAYTVARQTAPNAPTGQATLCVGSTATYSTTSTGGVWSTLGRASINSATGLATGTSGGATSVRYTITNASGCSAFADRPITVFALPAIPTIAYSGTGSNPQTGAGGGLNFCKNRTFGLVGNPTGGVWASSNSGVFSVTPLGAVTTVTNGPGSVTYTVTNANGCSNSRTISGTVVTCASRGVNLNDAPKADMDFTLYPNPANGKVSFNTEFVEAGGKITVTDMFGKTVRTLPLSIGTNNIDISTLSKGLYIVSMITKDGKKTKKLIVE